MDNLPAQNPLSKRKKIKMSRSSSDKGKHWTDRDKLKAIAAFAVTGNATEVENITGIPAGTVNYWKTLPWWFEEMEKYRKSEDEELTSKYTKIIKQTVEKISDRVENGDTVIMKDGSERLKPVSARDLAVIANTVATHRARLRETNSVTAVKALTMGDRLRTLEEQFTKFVTAKTIDGVVVSRNITVDAPEIIDAEQISETSENDASSSPQSEVCQEGGDSCEGGEGIQCSGQEKEEV